MRRLVARQRIERFGSAARALEIVGERWTLLIVRSALFGDVTRFSDFQRSLGVAPNILAKRLNDLVAAGILALREPKRGARPDYVLTKKGRDLMPIVVALTKWGDKWAAPDGAPVAFDHDGCGGRIEQRLVCSRCAEPAAVSDVRARVAPRFRRKLARR